LRSSMRISAPEVFSAKGTKSRDGEGNGGKGNAGLGACGDVARVTALWAGSLSTNEVGIEAVGQRHRRG